MVQAGIVNGGVTFVGASSRYRLDFHGDPANTPARLPRDSPSYLLDSRSEVVPFRPRPRAQQRLQTWRDSRSELSVLLVHGPGGQGKSRLAAQFANETSAKGWSAADASRTTDHPGQARQDPSSACHPLLVVVDYADRWEAELLAEFIGTLADERAGLVTRVLLLARSADLWWRDASSKLDRFTEPAAPLHLDGFEENDLPSAFDDAVEAFQRELKLPLVPIAMPNGVGEIDVSPLALHMTALAVTCAHRDHVPVPARRDLSRFLLHRERRYWADQAALIERVAFVATLFGPFESARAARSMLCSARIADGEAEADRVLHTYQRFYPSGRGHVVRAGNYIRTGQAACRYSWRTPPRRSRRSTARRSIRSGPRGWGRARKGAAAARDRWVRCWL